MQLSASAFHELPTDDPSEVPSLSPKERVEIDPSFLHLTNGTLKRLTFTNPAWNGEDLITSMVLKVYVNTSAVGLEGDAIPVACYEVGAAYPQSRGQKGLGVMRRYMACA